MTSEKSFTVYRHTAPNGKVYIGITSQMLCKRWANGRGYRNNFHFANAIKKYGWKNIKHEVLYTDLTQEEAERREIELIAEYDSTDPDKGYNRDFGGKAKAQLSEEAKKKISDSHIGRTNYVRGENHPMYGHKRELCPTYQRKHTAEEREKMSANNTHKIAVVCVESGVVYDSAESAAKAAKAHRGAILNCCRKTPHYNTAGGLHWAFANE